MVNTVHFRSLLGDHGMEGAQRMSTPLFILSLARKWTYQWGFGYVPVFICDANEQCFFQFLYPDTTLQRSKNYLKIPDGALTKALANFSILLQILLVSQEPIQLQEK